MGTTTSTVQIQNKQNMDAVVVASVDAGQHKYFSVFVPAGSPGQLKIARSASGKIKAYIRTIYVDGSANEFRMGIENKDTTDHLVLQRTNGLFNNSNRGDPVPASAPGPKQLDPAGLSESFAMMNGTPWPARVRITITDAGGFDHAPIDLEAAPAAIVKMNLSNRTKESGLTKASFVVIYANGTSISFKTTMKKFIPQPIPQKAKPGGPPPQASAVQYTKPPAADQILLCPREVKINGPHRRGGPAPAPQPPALAYAGPAPPPFGYPLFAKQEQPPQQHAPPAQQQQQHAPPAQQQPQHVQQHAPQHAPPAQQQPYGGQAPPPTGQAPPPTGHAPPPQQGYAPPPQQGQAPPPAARALPPQQGYAPPPQQGQAPNPYGGAPPQGYAPPPAQGYAPPAQGQNPYGAPPQGHNPYGAPPQGHNPYGAPPPGQAPPPANPYAQ